MNTTKKGPDYEGPAAAVVLQHINMLGSRKECAYTDLVAQFGEQHKARLFECLRELEENGQIREIRKGSELFYTTPLKGIW